jgi:excisionase family DNA binding protein
VVTRIKIASDADTARHERYRDVDEAAAYLGVTTRFVRRLIAEHRIAYHKLGHYVRIAESDLAAFAAAGRVEPWDVA